jgi:uncharacterized protein (DUF433 family)
VQRHRTTRATNASLHLLKEGKLVLTGRSHIPTVVDTRAQSDILRRMKKPIVISDPEILSGMPVYKGTRVPVQNLTDYLMGGDSIEVFLDDFPTVKRKQILAFLKDARDRAIATAFVNADAKACAA